MPPNAPTEPSPARADLWLESGLARSRSFALRALNFTVTDLAAAEVPRRRRLDVLETTQGIDWPSACVILVETRPSPHTDISRGSSRHLGGRLAE